MAANPPIASDPSLRGCAVPPPAERNSGPGEAGSTMALAFGRARRTRGERASTRMSY